MTNQRKESDSETGGFGSTAHYSESESAKSTTPKSIQKNKYIGLSATPHTILITVDLIYNGALFILMLSNLKNISGLMKC